MKKEILFEVSPQEERVAIIEDSKLVKFYIERSEKSIVGNIYIREGLKQPSQKCLFCRYTNWKKRILIFRRNPRID